MDIAEQISELQKRVGVLELEVQALRANRGIDGPRDVNRTPSMIPKPAAYPSTSAKENLEGGALSSNLKMPRGRITLAPLQLLNISTIITDTDVKSINVKPIPRLPSASDKRKNSEANATADSELEKKLYKRYVSTAMSTGETELYPKKKD